jgi:hypothetical protein
LLKGGAGLLRDPANRKAAPQDGYGKPFWQELDVVLVDAQQREKLRAAMGLV